MLPIILGLVGGYLIIDSQKEKLKFEDGGMMAKGGVSYGKKRVKYKGFEIIQHDGFCEIKGYSSMSGTFFQSGDIETIEQSKEVIDLALNEKNIPEIKDIHKRIVHYSDNRYNKNLPQYADGGTMAKGGKLDSGVYRVGKPTKVSPNLYEQKIVEIFDNGDIATASDYGRKLSDFSSQKYPIISKEKLDAQYKMADGGGIGVNDKYVVWVSKDGSKRELFGEFKSKRAADMQMKKLWEKGEYKGMGNLPKATYEKRGLWS